MGKYTAKFGRLGNSSGWCTEEKSKNEYLQLDLGKVLEISAVQTQGTWDNWLVTGYYLYYSDDGKVWTGYSESGDDLHSNSMCYDGKCSETRDDQCRQLWGVESDSGVDGCYKKLNAEKSGYGTCDPTTTVPCNTKNVLCGQLQCLAKRKTPIVGYGYNYTKITLDIGDKCSAAKLNIKDTIGQGMVEFGTKCGDGKICVDYKCQTFSELGIKQCPIINGVECSVRGVCLNTGKCHCDDGYDPEQGCEKSLVPRDGRWSSWTQWTLCDKGCNGGKQSRHRFCNNPTPAFGGKDCSGDRIEEQSCNTEPCPVAHSCRHLHQISIERNLKYPDGVYNIYPEGNEKAISAYCDMSRDGGGWTLLVTSHSNSWTADNVRQRNLEKPRLDVDYSMLSFGDVIKNNLNVKGSKFEYRLEAQSRGRWGGIWQAPRTYSFTSTNNGQTSVELVKRFDNWKYGDNSIEKRMPWISGARLTTSKSATKNWCGTITGDYKYFHPAPWIDMKLMESVPEFIWYWMREGPYVIPQSCMEVQMRGYSLPLENPLKDGEYTIKPPGHKKVKTYCDVTRNGGGWTLLVTSASKSGWHKDNIESRTPASSLFSSDFSILGVADAIKDFDKSQEFFEYRIEADGNDRWGGIFKAPRKLSFSSSYEKNNQYKVKDQIELIQQFDKWNPISNLGVRMPRLNVSPNILLSSAASLDDPSGTIVSNSDSKYRPTYLPGFKESPKIIRYWMREGTREFRQDCQGLPDTRLTHYN